MHLISKKRFEALKKSYQAFSEVAEPYLHIVDNKSYEQTLELIEELFDEVQDKDEDPINGLISLLGQAIARHEGGIETLAEFEKQAIDGPADVAMLPC